MWYGAILRADLDRIEVGAGTSNQDNAVVHTEVGAPAVVGPGCLVSHAAVIHGCEIGEGCLVSMGATVLTGAETDPHSVVGAGAVVAQVASFPPCGLILGVPARRIGEVDEERVRKTARRAAAYVQFASRHRDTVQQAFARGEDQTPPWRVHIYLSQPWWNRPEARTVRSPFLCGFASSGGLR